MMRKITGLLLILTLALSLAGCGAETPSQPEQIPSDTLVIYTSMRNVMIDSLVADFNRVYPGVPVDVQIAGAGSLMTRIESEVENGGIAADIIWTSEVPDFYYMKNQGWLMQYRPAGAEAVFDPLADAGGYFIPARLCTMGIAYNTGLVATPPADWHDLMGADFTGGFAIANPANSGTSFMSVGMLTETFGEQFFRDLRSNGAFVMEGSSQVVDAVASGELAACLAVDYMVFDKSDSDYPIAMAYPQELIVIPSPVAIFKDSLNAEAAKKFMDYIISPRAQQIIANSGTLPVSGDVTMPGQYNIPSIEDAMERTIQVNDDEMLTRKDELVGKFLAIMEE